MSDCNTAWKLEMITMVFACWTLLVMFTNISRICRASGAVRCTALLLVALALPCLVSSAAALTTSRNWLDDDCSLRYGLSVASLLALVSSFLAAACVVDEIDPGPGDSEVLNAPIGPDGEQQEGLAQAALRDMTVLSEPQAEPQEEVVVEVLNEVEVLWELREQVETDGNIITFLVLLKAVLLAEFRIALGTDCIKQAVSEGMLPSRFRDLKALNRIVAHPFFKGIGKNHHFGATVGDDDIINFAEGAARHLLEDKYYLIVWKAISDEDWEALCTHSEPRSIVGPGYPAVPPPFAPGGYQASYQGAAPAEPSVPPAPTLLQGQ